MKVCAACHFGVAGDGETVHCNWTGSRVAKDSWCENGDDDVEGLWNALSGLEDENAALRAQLSSWAKEQAPEALKEEVRRILMRVLFCVENNFPITTDLRKLIEEL